MSLVKVVVRAGLKPMQPMRLHWAPRLWWPRASGGPAPCVWKVVHFCQKFLALKFSRNGLYVCNMSFVSYRPFSQKGRSTVDWARWRYKALLRGAPRLSLALGPAPPGPAPARAGPGGGRCCLHIWRLKENPLGFLLENPIFFTGDPVKEPLL